MCVCVCVCARARALACLYVHARRVATDKTAYINIFVREILVLSAVFTYNIQLHLKLHQLQSLDPRLCNE
jgi:hypothetical protein